MLIIRRCFRISVFVALLAATDMFAHAQTITGSLRGLVTDPSGAAIPQAQVTATNEATGVTSSTRTNSSGLYTIQSLPIGRYVLHIEANGFEEQRSSTFTLEIDQQATIDVQMKVQGVSAKVVVSFDAAPILNTSNASLGISVDQQAIESMPLSGRDMTATTVAIPGSIHTSGQMNDGPAINGNRPETNSFILDGMDIYNQIQGQGFGTGGQALSSNDGPEFNPNPDSLQEIRVITSNANAEFGNANGGIVVAVTKSGTNQFHGGAFSQVENYKFGGANTWANKHVASGTAPGALTPYTQTYFGGSVGGPILKDRLFFFADYQGYRYHQSGTSNFSVPTQAMRTGDFSAFPQQLTYANGTSIPGNKLTVTNPVLIYLANNPAAWPLPTRAPADGIAQNDYTGPDNTLSHTDQGDAKIDWKIDAKNTLSGRYTMMNNTNGTLNAPVEVEFPGSLSGESYTSFVVNYTRVFSANAVNEARIGFGRNIYPPNVPTDAAGLFGISGNSKAGIGLPQALYVGFSQQQFDNANVNNIGDSSISQQFALNTYSYGDMFSLQHGHHLFKIGGEFLRYQTNFFYGGNSGALGTDEYSGTFSGYSFADFALDYAYKITTDSNTASVTAPSLFGQRQWRQSYFVQDDWKVMPRLTLNLGVRYDYFQPLYEVHNEETNVSLVNGALSYAGENGASRALYNAHHNEFQPRVGFTYSATPKFVVRGGYGISTYFEGMGVGNRLTNNAPWQQAFVNTSTPRNPITVQASSVPTSGVNTTGTSYQAWDPNIQPSWSQTFSLTTEYQISNSSSFQIGYVGQTEQHLSEPIKVDQWPTSCAGATTCPAAFYAATLGSTANIRETATNGMMNYNALQAVYRIRSSHGLDFTANYTWSKAMTNGGQGWDGLYGTNGNYYQQDATNFSAEYGPSPIDSANNLSAVLVYDLPFGHGRTYGKSWNRGEEVLLGGWKLSGLVSAFTGNPLTIDSNATGQYGTLLHDTGSQRANHLGKLRIVHGSVTDWFGTDPSAIPCASNTDNGTCAYSAESSAAFGTASNGSERGPGFRNIDISAFKAFHFTESQSLEFRADGYNAFNFANYGNPDTTVTDANFGQISGTRNGNGQRIMQFGLNYHF